MKNNIASFQEAVVKNPELVDKVMAASSLEEVAAIAGGEGFAISVEELVNSQELSEAEAESIAGGHGFHDMSRMSIVDLQKAVLEAQKAHVQEMIRAQMKAMNGR